MRLPAVAGFAALVGVIFGLVAPLRAVEGGPEIRLWEHEAPGALGTRPIDIPTLIVYRPEGSKRNGASMVVVPGGGYSYLAEPGNGQTYAEWLAANGVTAYVLHYRMGPIYHHPVQLNDAARAVRMVRSFARRDGLDPARVGVMGSSAGGHLAATVATQFNAAATGASDPIDRESARPDLAEGRREGRGDLSRTAGGPGAQPFHRTPGFEGYAAVLPLAYRGGQVGPGGEQPAVRGGAAPGRSAVLAPRLRNGTPRPRDGASRASGATVAGSAPLLVQGAEIRSLTS